MDHLLLSLTHAQRLKARGENVRSLCPPKCRLWHDLPVPGGLAGRGRGSGGPGAAPARLLARARALEAPRGQERQLRAQRFTAEINHKPRLAGSSVLLWNLNFPPGLGFWPSTSCLHPSPRPSLLWVHLRPLQAWAVLGRPVRGRARPTRWGTMLCLFAVV